MSSRVEEILNGTYEGKPQSRIEALLAGGAGSGGSGLSQTQVNNIVDSKISEVFSNLGETIDSKVLEAIEDLDISSGGDGGSSASKIDTLFEDTTYQGITNGTINLSESITNYDTIGFITINTVGNKEIRNSISCDVEFMIDYLITNNKILTITGYTSEYINLQMPDTRTINIESVDRNAIVKILGIKRTNIPVIDESTILFDTPTAISTNGMVFELNDDIRKYDQVIIYRGPYSNLSTKYSGVTIYKRDIIDSIDNGNAPIRVGANNWFSFHTSADGRSIVIDQADYSAIHEIIGVKTNVLKLNHIEADNSGILNLPQKTNLIASEISLSNGMTIQLSDSIKNYDVLLFQHKYLNGSNIGYAEHEYDVSIMNFGDSSKQILSEIENGVNVWWYPNSDGDAINVNVYGGNQHTITKIIGIKNPSFFDESLLPVQDGLIRWYDAINNTGTGAHDNAASTWKDLTGNGDATVSGSDVWADNGVSPAYGYIVTDLLFDSSFYASKSFTFEAYVDMLLNDGTIYHPIIYNKTFCFQMNPSHLLELAIETVSNNSWTRWIANADDARPFAKKLIDMTVDPINKTITFYIDGQQVYQGSFSAFTNSDSVPIIIGSVPPNSGDADRLHFLGLIHDVRIYDKALTPEEVQHNYAYSSQRYGNQPKIKITNPPTIQKSEWDLLSLQEKKSHGLTIIQDSDAGYKRGILVNGADYEPDHPQLALIDAFTVNTNAKTIVVPDDGMYLVSAACPYNSNHSVTLPQNAEILSQVDKSLNNTHLYAYIVRLAKYDVVEFNIQPDQWTGRSAAVIKLEGINDVLLLSSEFTIGSRTVTYSLPDDNHYYLVYGVGIDRFAGRDDSTNVGSNELACVIGNWGTTSANRVTVCKGSNSPNFSFYGYDGGFAAIIPWMISTDMIDDPGIEPVEIVGDSTEENTEPLE